MKTKITEHRRRFVCINCDPKCEKPAMSPAEAKAHLKDVHHLESATGTRNGILFMDGAGVYSNVFEWTFPAEVGEVKMSEFSEGLMAPEGD